jgi:hypothetical protein
MFEWLKRFCEIRIKSTINPINPISPTAQEDPKVYESIKRTRSTFEQQQQAMNARALKAHDSLCPDNWACEKDVCFIREPDKIVSTQAASSEEIAKVEANHKKNKAILKNMSKARVRKT